MKPFWLIPLALGAALARADDPGAALVQSALTELRTHPTLFIDISGKDTAGNVEKQLRTQLWWQYTTDANGRFVCQLECRDWVDGTLVGRIVGDGTTLWGYDPIRNRYSATIYGSYGSLPPDNYLKHVTQILYALAKGPAQYAARLLQDTWAGQTALFNPWMPQAGPSTQPVAGYVLYQFGDPLQRKLGFVTSTDANGTTTLSSFDYWIKRTVGGQTQVIEWQALLDVLTPPNPASFVFKAPTGARPVVGPQPQKG